MTPEEALARIVRLFEAAGLAEPRADAGVLVEAATGLGRTALLTRPPSPLGDAAARRLEDFVRRRLAREPVFRILGRRPFWGLELRVTPAVLDPRPDTETVVEAALAALGPRRLEPLRILDLGTGSGALLCALLSACPAAFGIGVDRSLAACAVAAGNLAACGVAARAGVLAADWAAPLAGHFDLVVANPPYIETAALAALDPEVRDHDPALALDGGPDGLTAYRQLAPALAALLGPTGLAVVEVGWTQAAAVAAILTAAGLDVEGTRADTAGHARAVMARPRQR